MKVTSHSREPKYMDMSTWRDSRQLPILIDLWDRQVEQAWREGETRQVNAVAAKAALYSRSYEGGDENLNRTWWHVQARAAELVCERWLGLPELPDVPYGASHFDTHEPWCVQVKSFNVSPRIWERPGVCWRCPYIFIKMIDVNAGLLTGWAVGEDLRRDGQRFSNWDGAVFYQMPIPQLRPLPGPMRLHARMFHRGIHSVCPHGR